MSFGFNSDQLPEKGIPSRIINGLLDAVIELVPRMVVAVEDPSAFEPVMAMFKPATVPCRFWMILG